MKKRKINRRFFLKTSAGLAAPLIITSRALGAKDRAPANDRIVMAGIGMGGRGRGVLGEFMRQPEIDGALVGGASLKADEFVSIARQTSEIRGLT